jgi:hypothetical protein
VKFTRLGIISAFLSQVVSKADFQEKKRVSDSCILQYCCGLTVFCFGGRKRLIVPESAVSFQAE